MLMFLHTIRCKVLLEQLAYSHCPIPLPPLILFAQTHICAHTLSSLLQCTVDSDKPQDTLTPEAQRLIKACGSHSTKVSKIVAENDPVVSTAIWEGLERANKHATSQQHQVCMPFNVQVELSSLLDMIKCWKSMITQSRDHTVFLHRPCRVITTKPQN